MKHHESIRGERVAMGWHMVWAALCLLDLAACCSVLAVIHPWLRVGWPVAWLLWTLVAQCVIATGGVLWHVVAALEHYREIARLGQTYHYTLPQHLRRPENRFPEDAAKEQ